MNRITDVILRPYVNGFILQWADNKGFFGEIYIIADDKGYACIDSEYTGKEFVKSVFNKMIDDGKLIK